MNNVFVYVVVLLSIGYLGFRTSKHLYADTGRSRSAILIKSLEDLTKATDDEVSSAARHINGNLKEIMGYRVRWSAVHWSFVFGAAVFSATAGFLPNTESFAQFAAVKADIASFLAITSALMITISTSGSFGNKWQANRFATAQLESLGYELIGEKTPDGAHYMKQLQEILKQRHLTIIGPVQQTTT